MILCNKINIARIVYGFQVWIGPVDSGFRERTQVFSALLHLDKTILQQTIAFPVSCNNYDPNQFVWIIIFEICLAFKTPSSAKKQGLALTSNISGERFKHENWLSSYYIHLCLTKCQQYYFFIL